MVIRFGAHIQRMMPSHVERQCFNCRCIAQIVQLLQKQNSDDDMQILRRPPHLRIKMRHQLANWKIFQKGLLNKSKNRRIMYEVTQDVDFTTR